MNIQSANYDIIQSIINLKDVEILLEIQQMLGQSQSASHNQMTIEEFYDRIAQSEKAFEEGNVISHEELKKEVQAWKSNR